MGSSRPKESDSQLIGKRAERAMAAHMPDEWIEVPQSGDGDYGIDYVVQVKDSSSELAASFFLQLKGTTTPEYVNDGKELSYSFKSKTLNYWAQVEPCVAVAVVDLTKSTKQSKCPTYYRFLDEDFFESISHKREENDSVTIRIPIDQVIDEELQILSYLLERLKTKNALLKIKQAVEMHSVTPNNDIKAIADAVHRKPVWLEAAREDSEAPWIENPDNHNAGKLKSLFDAITKNQILYAKELETEINAITNFSEHEAAEFLSLKASILSLNGDDQGAEELYQKSFNKLPVSRYKVNYFESKFRLDLDPADDDLEEMIKTLDSSVYRECVLKAKCHALLGCETQAIEELENHPGEKILIAKMLIYTITGNIDDFENAASEVVLEKLKPRQKYLFHAMLGRRMFYKGIQYDEDGDFAIKVIPFKGKSKYDINLLKEAYQNIKEALKHARTIGYPNDLTILIAANYHSGKKADALKLTDLHKEKILQDKPQNYDYLLCMAAQCAYETLQPGQGYKVR